MQLARIVKDLVVVEKKTILNRFIDNEGGLCTSKRNLCNQRTAIFYGTKPSALEQLEFIDQNQTVNQTVIA